MNLEMIVLGGLGALGLAMAGSAGSVMDQDRDLVADQFDNCLTIANGPDDFSNQIDTDLDGFGNRCDADFNNDGVTTGSDFSLFVSAFNTLSALHDLNGDGVVSGADYSIFVTTFGTTPGPSGLDCAGSIPCPR